MLNGYKPKATVAGNYDPIPMGVYTCQIVDVNAVTQFNKFKGEEQELMNYQLAVLDDVKDEKGASLRGRYVWVRCSPVFSIRSWLYKLTKGIFGRELTDEEKANFDFESIVGRQVKCVIQPKPNADGSAVFNNIVSFDKATTELPKIEFQAKAKETVVKTSVPVTAPEEDEDPDKLIAKLEAEQAAASTPAPAASPVAQAKPAK